jgi:activator of HSP90 ATPase
MKINENNIKKIKPIGFQLGVSKTFAISYDAMWEFLLSENGISVWLGEINFDDFGVNKPYLTKQGIEGKLNVFKPDSHLRLTWKPKHWQKFSIIEMRITNSKGRARIVFHHTNLYEVEQRIEMKKYWDNVILNIENKLKK